MLDQFCFILMYRVYIKHTVVAFFIVITIKKNTIYFTIRKFNEISHSKFPNIDRKINNSYIGLF